MDADINKLTDHIENLSDQMIGTLVSLIKIPAVNPNDGGKGETAKAEYLMKLLKEEFKFDRIENMSAEDPDAPNGTRPNIIAYTAGKSDSRRIWVIAHVDVVPEGNPADWKVTSAFEPVVKDGKIYGRGSEDNGQSLVSAMYAMKTLHDMGIKPAYDTYLAFVSDEEVGSTYGIKYLLKQGLFRENDIILVPDSGVEDGSFIEVSEKSIVWLKVTSVGKQVHASMPEQGKNAFKAAMTFGSRVIEHLYTSYNIRDELFDPPISTFEPTKKEANVQNINTIPGEDVFYIDCRILPQYDPDDVIKDMGIIAAGISDETGVKITVEPIMMDRAAPPTPKDAEVVLRLKKALAITRPELKTTVGGIGGGTCAAILRRAGYNVVVWSTIDDMAHAPDEYAVIKNLVDDAKTMVVFFIIE